MRLAISERFLVNGLPILSTSDARLAKTIKEMEEFDESYCL